MTPSLYKIFCIGVIWFIYTIVTFISFLKYKIKNIIHFFILSFISFLYNSEKDYFSHINKSKSIKYPNNIAIILNKFLIKEEKIILTLCKLIRWMILTNKIKYLTIYDAFNLLNIQTLIVGLNEQIKNNKNIYDKIKIHISYKDNKNEKIIVKNLGVYKNDINSLKFNFYICFINFKQSNDDLIEKIIKEKKTKIYGNYPSVYKWFDKNKENLNKNDKKKEEPKDKKNNDEQKKAQVQLRVFEEDDYFEEFEEGKKFNF